MFQLETVVFSMKISIGPYGTKFMVVRFLEDNVNILNTN